MKFYHIYNGFIFNQNPYIIGADLYGGEKIHDEYNWEC